jgi:hypothetical protein
MRGMSQTPLRTVKETGARADELLVGITPRNMGIVVRIFNDQPSDEGGRIVGPFEVLHWGTGTYATDVLKLWHQQQSFASVEEFIDRLSSVAPGTEFTHGLNANGLWRLDPEIISNEITTAKN